MPHSQTEQLNTNEEAQKAFEDLTAYLEQQVAEQGKPVVTREVPGSTYLFSSYGEDHSKQIGEDFAPNATQLGTRLTDTEGKTHQAWMLVLGSEVQEQTSKLAKIEIGSTTGSHPADVYIMRPDKSVEKLRLTAEDDGVDEDGDPINWRDRIDSEGLLDSAQIKDLLETISGEKPLTHGTKHEKHMGSVAIAEVSYDHDDSEEHHDNEEDEDPLKGAVDRFIPSEETRTDDQIAHDEDVANRLHMSGADDSDDYWADYDEYFGTVNGGEDPEDES